MVVGLDEELTVGSAIALAVELGEGADGIVGRSVREVEEEGGARIEI